MDVRLSLTTSSTIHVLFAARRRGWLPASASYQRETGVLLGVRPIKGIDALGYRQPTRTTPRDRATRLNIGPYLPELASEANPYGRRASRARGTV